MSFIQNIRSYFHKHRDAIPCTPQPDVSEPYYNYLKAIPKSEIHVHFEGSISAQVIYQLVRKYDVDDIKTENDAHWALTFKSPYEFFHRFLFVSSLLREPEDFYTVAQDIAKRLDDENIRYAEFHLAPHKFIRAGVEFATMIDAIGSGLKENRKIKGEYKIIVDIVRDLGPEMGMEMLKIIEQHPHPSIVAIGLGGGEQFVPELSAEAFRFAESLGLQKTAHAGEGRGPLSIWGVIRSLGVKRIDHGVRAREDTKLVDYLVKNQISLNLCPSSNVILGVVAGIETHPIREYYVQGIPINVSTDDPTFFKVTLTQELANLITYQGFTIDEIPQLIENSLRASFLSAAEKERYINEFRLETQDLAQSLLPAQEP